MNKRKEKLTQLYQLGVKVDLNAVKTILYTDKLRSAISEFMRYLRADAYFLTGNEQLKAPDALGYPYTNSMHFPNVVYLIASARTSDKCCIGAIVKESAEEPISVLKMADMLGRKGFCGSLPVLNFGEFIQLFQYVQPNGRCAIPRLFQRSIGSRGEVLLKIMRTIFTVNHDGKYLYSVISLKEVLGIYGIENSSFTDEKSPEVEDRILKSWVDLFNEKFRDLTASVQSCVKKGCFPGQNEKTDEDLNNFFLFDLLADKRCRELFELVEDFYKKQSGVVDTSLTVEPATSNSSSKLECENVRAVLCTLESTEQTSSIPALNRPRHVGWFNRIEDAVDFVTYELENSPMYKEVESVEKKILENGDIEVTINSVVKLVYRFEIIQK